MAEQLQKAEKGFLNKALFSFTPNTWHVYGKLHWNNSAPNAQLHHI